MLVPMYAKIDEKLKANLKILAIQKKVTLNDIINQYLKEGYQKEEIKTG
jgi:uncharacterized protein YeeX (DUF496 family)